MVVVGRFVYMYTLTNDLVPFFLSPTPQTQHPNTRQQTRNVAYLAATGSDDGSFKVWDLRQFGQKQAQDATKPIAHFTWHQGAWRYAASLRVRFCGCRLAFGVVRWMDVFSLLTTLSPPSMGARTCGWHTNRPHHLHRVAPAGRVHHRLRLGGRHGAQSHTPPYTHHHHHNKLVNPTQPKPTPNRDKPRR